MNFKEYYRAYTEEELGKGAELFFADEIQNIRFRTEPSQGIIHKIMGKIKTVCGEYQTRTPQGHQTTHDCFVSITEKHHLVIEAGCECDDFQKDLYGCPHTAALLTAYMTEKHGAGFLKGTKIETLLQNMTMTEDPFTPGVLKRTDDRLRNLLTGNMDEALPVWHEHTEQTALFRSECALSKLDNTVRLSIKAGPGRLYQIKELPQFLSVYRENGIFTFGKKEYRIGQDCCEPLTRKLLNYLAGLQSAAEKGNYGKALFGQNPTAKDERYMMLSDRELDQFFQIMDGENLYVNEILTHVQLNKKGLKATMKKKAFGASLEIDNTEVFCVTDAWMYLTDGESIFRLSAESAEKTRELENLLSYRDALYIRDSEIAQVVRQILPVFREYGVVETKGLELATYDQEKPTYEFDLDYSDGFLLCKPFAIYANQNLRCPLYDSDMAAGQRNAREEAQAAALLQNVFQQWDRSSGTLLSAMDEEALYLFLNEKLPFFEEMGTVMVTDALKHSKVKRLPSAAIGVRVEEGKMFMSLSATGLSPFEMDEILRAYVKKKKYYRLKSGSFFSLEKENDEIENSWDTLAELYQHYGSKDPENIALPLFRSLYLQEMLANREDASFETNDGYRDLLAKMQPATEKTDKIPESLKDILRPYQKEGFFWIQTLKNCGFGGILADDMGLGKTLQVLCFLLSEKEKGKKERDIRTLIVTPASLLYNWEREIKVYTPQLNTVVIAGNAATRKALIQSSSDAEIWLTSYDLLKRDIAYYEDIHFANEIIDEAQFIKNQNTQASQSVRIIDSDFRMALTGTPIENHLSELWSIMNYLMPGFLYGYQRFQKEFEVPVVVQKNENVLERLRKMVHPFILRRMKNQVLKELPEKMEEVVSVRMEGKQRKLYQALTEEIRLSLSQTASSEFKREKLQFLAQLTKLRQVCCDPALLYENYNGGSAKLETCMQLIRQAVDGGHKLLLFSQFTSMLDIICGRLTEEHLSFYRIDGSVSKKKRMEMVDAFAYDEVPVFCISLKAGGTGLNLTAADIVIHYDPWWNKAAQNQATDRTHRIGQTHHVNVYELIAADTIEERIQSIKDSKSKLAEDVLSGESIASAVVNKEDLLKLLG